VEAGFGCEAAVRETGVAGIETLVRVGDTVFDASLLNQLDRLRQVTLEKTTQQIRDSIERFEIAE